MILVVTVTGKGDNPGDTQDGFNALHAWESLDDRVANLAKTPWPPSLPSPERGAMRNRERG